MPLSFLVPAFLVGLAALAIPVLIHLSRRQTKEPVRFPSLMFLQRIPQQTEQRRRIHRWPLLILRALALLLLILAFARPFVDSDDAGDAAATTGSREVVVLVDQSYSMSVGDRWDRAVAAAEEVIDGLSGTDRGTVILFDSGAESATQSTVDQQVLRNAVEDAEPGPFTTRYAPAIRYGARLLSSSPLPRHEMVVISDFQRSGWDVDGGEISSIRLPAGTEITPISVSEVETSHNVTVADADVERETAAGRERVTVTARLIGTGSLPPTVPVTLSVDGRPVETLMASFDEGDNASVAFNPVTLPQTGTVRGHLAVADDDLATDDELNFVLSSDQRMGVLILDGSGGGERSSFFLERALAIGDEPGFRTEMRRSSQVTALDLASNSVVILNQEAFPSGESGERLRSFVEQGGGVVMILGDNRIGEWSGTLPSVAQAVDRTSAGGTTMGYIDTGHPVFEAFAGPRSGDFSSARFFRYRPINRDALPRILARYADGGIALGERPVENGRLLVWTSTLDSNWNDLALQPVFLPFLHQLVRYAAGYSPPRGWLTVGEPLDPRAIAPVGEEFVLALTPDGERLDLTSDSPFTLEQAGFYELRRSEDDQQPVTFAVNVDPGEAETTAFDPEEMRSALLAAVDASAGTAADRSLTLAERERQQSGWWYLVVIAFALFAAETLLSNRAKRARQVVGNR